ncbi:MAG: 2,3-diphosphoglycerate-dependent phosphoglycerate mutase [Candidatus Falkowbacteria bacterium]|nr:MAG: 2,3-diphosphoglycerate-dependent phosphoglycerate mutase [Candidatus Falkowbacteria bacterium]
MYKIVLLRHGESTWNKKGLFTGWTDVDLTAKGREEALNAGTELFKKGFKFDLAFTSLLKRASKTLAITLKTMKQKPEVISDWRLNERHYGNLQGLNKKEMAAKFGEQQILIWRRSYSTPPPKIDKNNPFNQKNDSKYKGIKVPETESLKDVVARVMPFWKDEVVPQIKAGKKIIIAASGNSLRAIVKYLDKISATEISGVNIPTGIPLIYELDKKLKPVKHYYLADKKTLAAAIDKVKKQGTKK